jgi:uncharacterized protein (DUF488 family)
MKIYTIGFGQKSASEFFGALERAGIKRLVDIRLNNTSQLAGFTKKDDLRYFLRRILLADYRHEPMLAPTQDILDTFKKSKGSWEDYERSLLALMDDRKAEDILDRSLFETPTVLLCSEPKPDKCHRRLVAEYLKSNWGNVEIAHL